MQKRVRKAVFPVAGLGTRFLPAAKAVPKEMLNIVDRPVIQRAVDEAREAGIEHFVFVTGRNKGAIEDHFDRQAELEDVLRNRGKTAELDLLESDLPIAGQMSFTRQQLPLGLGHAVWCAREIVGDEPFAVLLPDMVMKAEPGCLKQMMSLYEETGGNIIAVEEVPWKDVGRYGVVRTGTKRGESFAITGMVEKPYPTEAPSNLAIAGRYILQPEIFAKLAAVTPGVGKELQLTDAMVALMAEQPFWAFGFEGETFDCGDKLGLLLANLSYGLSHPELGQAFRTEVRKKILEDEHGRSGMQGKPMDNTPPTTVKLPQMEQVHIPLPFRQSLAQ